MSTNPASKDIHPFLKGNFAPVTEEYISSACQVTGRIPDELLGGQYIRNGGNPVYPPEQGRHYHWCVLASGHITQTIGLTVSIQVRRRRNATWRAVPTTT